MADNEPKNPPPNIILRAKTGAKDAFPKEGARRTRDQWTRIERFVQYASNYRALAERHIFLKRLDGAGEVEFQGTATGWHRVQDNKIVEESPSDELLALLHKRQLLRVIEVPDDALPEITRQITPEERRICRGMGRPTPMWRVQAERVKLAIVKRRDP